MRHLAALALLIAAAAAYLFGSGPQFLGKPLIGLAFVLVGLCFEITFWRRVTRKGKSRPAVG